MKNLISAFKLNEKFFHSNDRKNNFPDMAAFYSPPNRIEPQGPSILPILYSAEV